jgi:hypothetical protein
MKMKTNLLPHRGLVEADSVIRVSGTGSRFHTGFFAAFALTVASAA